MKQSELFAAGEGDAWFERNKNKLDAKHGDDPVINLIQRHVAKPEFIYEVGCANGWRLKQAKTRWGCEVGGIDPSREAVWTAHLDELKGVDRGSANKLWIGAKRCDVLIYGFCLYLCDPEDYFTIAAEGDRVLKDGGYLIIHDFDFCSRPYRVPYEHLPGIWSHHVAFERLWAGHPRYRILEQISRYGQAFTIMKKDSAGAWG